MSEKSQRTAASLRDKMQRRYSDIPHKHNKCHHEFRRHYRSHPVTSNTEIEEELNINSSTGLLREFKLRKIRKRLAKGQFH